MKLCKLILTISILLSINVLFASDSINVYSQVNIYPYYFDGEDSNIGILPDALSLMLGENSNVNYYTHSCSTCDEFEKPDILCLPDDEAAPAGYSKYSIPIQIEYVVCFRKGEPIESLIGLNNKKVIIIKNDYPFESLYKNRVSYILNVGSAEEALRTLSQGYNDCAVLPLQAVLSLLETKQFGNIDYLHTPFLIKPLAIAVKQSEKLLDSSVNISLKNILKDGTFETISKRWMTHKYAKNTSVAAWAFVVIALLVMLIAIMILWIKNLYDEIEDATREQVDGIINKDITPITFPHGNKILQQIMRSAPFWFTITDKNGHIVRASYAFLRTVMHVDELPENTKFKDVVDISTAEILQEYDNQIIAGNISSAVFATDFKSTYYSGGRWVVKHPFKYSDHSEIYILTAIVPPVLNKNPFYQNLDVTDLLQEIIDSLQDLVYFKNAEGRYQQVNKAFCNYYKLDENNIIGKTDYELFGEKVSESYSLSDNIVLSEGKMWSEQDWHTDSQGDNHKFINYKTPLLNSENKIFGLVGISHEITEIDNFTKQIKRLNEKIEETEKFKASFLANMGHDVRNPLKAIIEFSDLLADIDLTYDQRIEIIEMIQANGNMLIDLINDIVDYSKIETKKIQIKYSDFNLNSVVADVYNIANTKKMQLNKDNMVISLLIDTIEDDIIIHSDSYRLKQILKNMITTFIKFADTERIYFGYRTTNDNVYFFVNADKGDMTREDLILYADEHDNHNISLSQIEESYGISIIIAQSIIEMMGGKLWVENINSGRPSIVFYIPYERDENLSTVVYDSKNDEFKIPNWAGNTILIAEDEELNFILVQGLMLRTKVKVIRAKNGIEAVQLYKANPDIDVVLMDIRMPEMNGLEASELILNYDNKADIIALTAHAIPEVASRCSKIGIHRMLEKPIDQRELFTECNKYMKHGKNNNDKELMD